MREVFSGLLAQSRRSTEYIVKQIEHVCRNMKKRAPGSEGEFEVAQYMAGILKNEGGCEDVRVESFDEHPGAFYGYLYFSAPLDCLCCLTSFISPWLSIAFGLAALILFIVQFVLYIPVVDPFFPKAKGTNVTAIRRSSLVPRRRVILCGHTDAAWEWPVNYRFGGVAFEAHGALAVVGVLYYIALGIFALCGASWVRTASLIGIVFIPVWIGLCFMRDKNLVVDGANDNLTGCYMGIELLRAMESAGLRLEETELCAVLTGSEEAGLKGAKAWCRAHREEFSDIPTYVYCFDTIHDPRFLMANDRDLNSTVASDRRLGDLFAESAAELGIPCRRGWVPPMGGSTDSSAFTRAGFRSIGITGLDHKLEDYYHTRRDSWDNLNEEGIENCYRALVRTMEKIDSGALEQQK